MYIVEPGMRTARLSIPMPVKSVLLLTSMGIFWLGILPGSWMRVIGDASARVFPGF